MYLAHDKQLVMCGKAQKTHLSKLKLWRQLEMNVQVAVACKMSNQEGFTLRSTLQNCRPNLKVNAQNECPLASEILPWIEDSNSHWLQVLARAWFLNEVMICTYASSRLPYGMSNFWQQVFMILCGMIDALPGTSKCLQSCALARTSLCMKMSVCLHRQMSLFLNVCSCLGQWIVFLL